MPVSNAMSPIANVKFPNQSIDAWFRTPLSRSFSAAHTVPKRRRAPRPGTPDAIQSERAHARISPMNAPPIAATPLILEPDHVRRGKGVGDDGVRVGEEECAPTP